MFSSLRIDSNSRDSASARSAKSHDTPRSSLAARRIHSSSPVHRSSHSVPLDGSPNRQSEHNRISSAGAISSLKPVCRVIYDARCREYLREKFSHAFPSLFQHCG